MPQGYYTIEQWTRGKKGSPGAWVEILHLPFGRSMTHGNARRSPLQRLVRRRGIRVWNSLSRGWLPKFDLVALWIHDPTELSVLGIVRLLQDVASFVPKRLKESRQVFDAIVDHEGRLAWREVLTIGGADQPRGRSLGRIARRIGPGKRGPSPF